MVLPFLLHLVHYGRVTFRHITLIFPSGGNGLNVWCVIISKIRNVTMVSELAQRSMLSLCMRKKTKANDN